MRRLLTLLLCAACGGSGTSPTPPLPVEQLVGRWSGQWEARDLRNGGFMVSGPVAISIYCATGRAEPCWMFAALYGLHQQELPLTVAGSAYRGGHADGVWRSSEPTFVFTFGHSTDPREIAGTFTMQNPHGEHLVSGGTFSAAFVSTSPVRLLEQWEQGGWLIQFDVTYTR